MWASEGKHQNLKCPAQKFGGLKIPEKNAFPIRDILLNNFPTDKFFQAFLLFSEHPTAEPLYLLSGRSHLCMGLF